jgi:hypothetical protein
MTHKKNSEEIVPKSDTKYGPGLESHNTALDEETDPLAAFNAEKGSSD